MRPWGERALEPEFVAKHGHYADFAAWEEWMSSRGDHMGTLATDFDVLWEAIDDRLARVALYSVMCEVADFAEARTS